MREESTKPFVVYNSLKAQKILDKRREAAEAYARRAAEDEKVRQEIGDRSRSRFNNDPQPRLVRAEIEAEIARLQRLLEREGM